MPRAAALIALLAALSLAACGGDDPAPKTTTTTAERPPGPIRILAPKRDAKVKAGDDGGELTARPTISGTADPGADVVVTGACNAEGCVVHAPADDEGKWEARVRLEAPADAPDARVSVYYRGLVVGPEDKVLVRLVGPRREQVRTGGGRGQGDRGGGSGGGGDGNDDVVPPDAIDPQPVPAPSGPGDLILIGDSLAVGIEGLLPAQLPGWTVATDALTSRPLAAGMTILARTRVPDGAVVAMSLFTNDDPTHTAALEEAVRTSVRRAGPRGCAVWATIARPPFNGRSYAAANALLHRLDAQLGRRLALVPWAEQASRAGWLAGDGVHGTPEGYRQRARLYAAAARSCRG
jgi:hypothetical protein